MTRLSKLVETTAKRPSNVTIEDVLRSLIKVKDSATKFVLHTSYYRMYMSREINSSLHKFQAGRIIILR